MSNILTKEVAKQAFSLIRPVFDKLVEEGLTGDRLNLHVVVMCPNKNEILYEKSWGDDPATWKRPYANIAIAKADLSRRTGMVGRSLQTDAPWLYEPGDVRYVGGVIENGLVVAASGLQDFWDEAISWMVLSAIQGLCRSSIADIPSDASPFFR